MQPNFAILLIAFNRWDCFRESWRAVTSYFSCPILVHIDGARNADDRAEQEKIVEFVRGQGDTPFEIRWLEKNLGCRAGVMAALDWGFSFNEILVVVEDDIIVTGQFKNLFDYWVRHRVSSPFAGICGWNGGLDLPKTLHMSVYGSGLFRAWGWATTREVWEGFRNTGRNISQLFGAGKCYTLRSCIQIKIAYIDSLIGRVDTWDYDFFNHIWANKLKFLVPSIPLVGNIGDKGGAHAAHRSVYYGEIGDDMPEFCAQFVDDESIELLDRKFLELAFDSRSSTFKTLLVFIRSLLWYAFWKIKS